MHIPGFVRLNEETRSENAALDTTANPLVVGGEQGKMTDAPISKEWVVVLINRHRNHTPAPQ